MGALIAFELARLLQFRKGPAPLHLFLAGQAAPHLPRNEAPMHQLPQPELVNALRHMSGTPPEILDNAEALALFVPMLRADFSLVERYHYSPGPPLTCPVYALGGLEDPNITREDLSGWARHTTRFALTMLPGNHFFILKSIPSVMTIIVRTLAHYLC